MGDSVDNRTWLWRIGARMVLDHPLTGVGRGNWLLMFPLYLDPSLPPRLVGPHSTPVQVLAETGLIGLAAYAATLAVALVGLRDARRRLAGAAREREALLLEGIEIAIYGYVVSSVFLNDNIYQRSLWLLVGLAAAGRQVALRAAAGGSPAAAKRPSST
jgi:O-antigen ligase